MEKRYFFFINPKNAAILPMPTGMDLCKIYVREKMNEADITNQISEVLNRIWLMQQWWASVSFGVLIVAHVAGRKLGGLLIFVILFLYTVYSIYMWDLLGINAGIANGFVSDLENMSSSGATLTGGGSAYITTMNQRLSYFLVPLALFGTYFSATGYLIYSYFKGRDHRNV